MQHFMLFCRSFTDILSNGPMNCTLAQHVLLHKVMFSEILGILASAK